MNARFKDWVNGETAKELDKQPFSSLPLQMRIGIFILLAGFFVGNVGPILMGILVRSGHQPVADGVLRGSILYGLGQVIGLVGIFLAGRKSIKYPIFFFAKLVKFLFPRSFR